MYESLVTALRMCGYPWSVYYCGHGCPFSEDGAQCTITPLLSAAAQAIEDMSETLHDYRTACKKVLNNESPATP
jgi:hypothetical protein